jgi:Pyruvate/2-oxoacid:ferredoxin oxidoreductase delta subunit
MVIPHAFVSSSVTHDGTSDRMHNCHGVCPDNAVMKLGTNTYDYEFDFDYRKWCGICAEECPCGAIKREPEDI